MQVLIFIALTRSWSNLNLLDKIYDFLRLSANSVINDSEIVDPVIIPRSRILVQKMLDRHVS